MSVIDTVILAAVAVSVVIGFIRGFVKEAIAMVSLLVAAWAAFRYGSAVGATLADRLNVPFIMEWSGHAAVFIALIAIGALLSRGLSRLVHLSFLSGLDRLLGAAFGFARSALLLAAVTMIIAAATDLERSDWWRESRFIPYLQDVAEWVQSMLPEGYDWPDSMPGNELAIRQAALPPHSSPYITSGAQ